MVKTALNAGIPPRCSVTTIAIGVVADFGASDRASTSGPPTHRVTSSADATAALTTTTVPRAMLPVELFLPVDTKEEPMRPSRARAEWR